LERNIATLQEKKGQFVDFLKKMKVTDVLLTGGEPLLLGGVLFGIIELLGRSSISYSMSTSGDPLELLQKISALPEPMKPRRVNLSFDPIDESKRGFWKSDFSRLDKIITLLENDGVPCKITSVVTVSNLHDLEGHVSRLSALARSHTTLKNIAITATYSIGRGLECKGLELDNLKRILKVVTTHSFPTGTSLSLINMPSLHENLQACPAGQSIFSIMPDGEVTPCSMLYNLSRSFGAGNVLKETPDNIIAKLDAFSQGVAKHIGEIKIQNKRCLKCKSVENCGGGCFAIMPVLTLDHSERIICKQQPKLIADQQKEIFLSIERPPQAEVQASPTSKVKSRLDPKTERRILDYLKTKRPKTDPAHSLEHIINTADIARYIAREEKANEKIAVVAAYLHDLAPRNHSMHHFHTVRSARLAQIVLEREIGGFSEAEINHIQQCIMTSSYGSYLLGYKPQTIEAEIVRDADFLEAIGARGVARTFAFGAYYGTSEMGSVEHSPRKPPTIFDMNLTGPDHSPIHHFFTKLLKLKGLILTRTGKELAATRHDFMVRFLEQYAKEESLGKNKTLQASLDKFQEEEKEKPESRKKEDSM
jgi:uncharacterized protein